MVFAHKHTSAHSHIINTIANDPDSFRWLWGVNDVSLVWKWHLMFILSFFHLFVEVWGWRAGNGVMRGGVLVWGGGSGKRVWLQWEWRAKQSVGDACLFRMKGITMAAIKTLRFPVLGQCPQINESVYLHACMCVSESVCSPKAVTQQRREKWTNELLDEQIFERRTGVSRRAVMNWLNWTVIVMSENTRFC